MNFEAILRKFAVVVQGIEQCGLARTELTPAKSPLYPIPKGTDEKAHIMTHCAARGMGPVLADLTTEVGRATQVLLARRSGFVADMPQWLHGTTDNDTTGGLASLHQLCVELRRLHTMSTQHRRILGRVQSREAAWARLLGMISCSNPAEQTFRDTVRVVQRLTAEVVDDLHGWHVNYGRHDGFTWHGVAYMVHVERLSHDLRGNRLALKSLGPRRVTSPFLVDHAEVKKIATSGKTKETINAQRMFRVMGFYESLLADCDRNHNVVAAAAIAAPFLHVLSPMPGIIPPIVLPRTPTAVPREHDPDTTLHLIDIEIFECITPVTLERPPSKGLVMDGLSRSPRVSVVPIASRSPTPESHGKSPRPQLLAPITTRPHRDPSLILTSALRRHAMAAERKRRRTAEAISLRLAPVKVLGASSSPPPPPLVHLTPTPRPTRTAAIVAACRIQKLWRCVYAPCKAPRIERTRRVALRRKVWAVGVIAYHWRNALCREILTEFKLAVKKGRERVSLEIARKVEVFRAAVGTIQTAAYAVASLQVRHERVVGLVAAHRHHSRCVLQRFARCVVARSQTKSQRTLLARNMSRAQIAEVYLAAVTRVQTIWRTRAASKSKKLNVEKVERLDMFPRRQRAAVRIQSVFRSHMVRKTVMPPIAAAAAVALARVSVAHLRLSAGVRIQSFFRWVLSKKYCVKRKKQRFREEAIKMPTASERYRQQLRVDPLRMEALCQEHINSVMRRVGDGRRRNTKM